MLTLEEFNKINHGMAIAKGETVNSPEGIYMTDTRKGEPLRWIAVKGFANDWCLYTEWADKSWDYVEVSGQKVFNKENIMKLVSCAPDVLVKYRF